MVKTEKKTAGKSPALKYKEVLEFKVDNLVSKFNPRKRMTAESLRGLANSIKAYGVISPILVCWSMPEHGKVRAQIIAGHRRAEAAKLAGLVTVPVRYVDGTDVKTTELSIVENIQREELPPLDEAHAMKDLKDSSKMEVRELAARFGKSMAYVTRRIALTGLSPRIQKEMQLENLALSVAELLLRIQDPKSRDEAVGKILERDSGNDPEEAARTVSEYQTALSSAPWKLDDADLFKAAGPCSKCPKRSSAQSELFDHADKHDRCLDAACFAQKTRKFGDRRIKELGRQGARVLKAAPKGVTAHWNGTVSISHDGPLVSLTDHCNLDPKYRDWKQLLGPVHPKDLTAFQDKAGRIHYLVERKRAVVLLKARGHKFQGSRIRDSEKQRAKAAEENLRDRAKSAGELAAIDEIVGKIQAGSVPRLKWEKVMGILLTACMGHAGTKTFLRLRPGLKDGMRKTSWGGTDYGPAIRSLLAKTHGRFFDALAAEMLLAEKAAGNWSGYGELGKACGILGVNVKRHVAGALKEFRAARKKKAKPKAKPKRKARPKK